MNPRKNTFLILLPGLLLVAFAAVSAQTPSQGEQKKKTENCCAMDSCCTGDSCDMKKEGEANAEGKHDCCSGDSCDMKMNHDENMKHDKDAKGDCCNMKNKDKNKKKNT
jgi:hypothetical protein